MKIAQMSDTSLPSPLAEYEAKRLSVQITLRRYYNECVAVMAQEEAGEIDIDKALDFFLQLDAKYAKLVVDDISPLKSILQQ